MLHSVLMKSSSSILRTRVRPSMMPAMVQRRLSVSVAAFEGNALPQRTFVDFSIYKGKGAVQCKVIPPSFGIKYTTGEKQYADHTLEREGVLLLEFANVLPSQGPQAGYGNRNYDWGNKVTFGLKALELAQLTDFDVTGPPQNSQSQALELFHDPNKGSSDPNVIKTTKTLKLMQNPQGDGYMISIFQKQGATSTSIAVPVTRAEFVTLKHIAAYLVPRLYGFDLMFENAGNHTVSPATRF